MYFFQVTGSYVIIEVTKVHYFFKLIKLNRIILRLV